MVEIEIELLEYLFFNTFINDINRNEVKDRISKKQAKIFLEIKDSNFQEVLKKNIEVYNEILNISEK